MEAASCSIRGSGWAPMIPQARPEEAQAPSCGALPRGTLTMLAALGDAPHVRHRRRHADALSHVDMLGLGRHGRVRGECRRHAAEEHFYWLPFSVSFDPPHGSSVLAWPAVFFSPVRLGINLNLFFLQCGGPKHAVIESPTPHNASAIGPCMCLSGQSTTVYQRAAPAGRP